MAGEIRVEISPNYAGWIRGFASLPTEAAQTGAVMYRQVAQVFFERSQAVVHVITGALKASGTIRVTDTAEGVMTEIEYGGGAVDYAGYEIARGGSHDFMTIAFNETEAEFKAVMPAIWERLVLSWS